MQQLTGLDASFLYMENASTYGHVAGLAIFDTSGLDEPLSLEAIKTELERRLHLAPPYRRRLVQVPLQLDHPYWIEDPDFDLDYHVRHIAVPPPGDERQLAELCARICARHLDRNRPLWEMYVIEGLADGHVAELTKIHHACIDGMAGAELMAVLLDLSPEGTEIPPPERPWEPEAVPSDWEMLARGMARLAERPGKALSLTRRTLRSLPGLAGQLNLQPPRLPWQRETERRPGAPRTPFNGVITPHRRFAYGSLPLDEVKRIKNAAGATVNDVVMALCAGALRRWLIDHDALPDSELMAMVPVSVRDPAQAGAGGNQVSSMIARLPTNLEDPLERLRFIHEEMNVLKDRFATVPANLLADWAEFTPPQLMGLANRVIARTRIMDRLNPPFNVVISNVPGPQFPLYSMGARLVANYPISAITDGVGLNMTVMSYDGHLDFGLVACREMVPDLWTMMDGLTEELEVLGKAVDAG